MQETSNNTNSYTDFYKQYYDTDHEVINSIKYIEVNIEKMQKELQYTNKKLNQVKLVNDNLLKRIIKLENLDKKCE